MPKETQPADLGFTILTTSTDLSLGEAVVII